MASSAALVAAALIVTALGVVGCKDKGPAASYSVRGQIETLNAIDGAQQAFIHHEAIPTFVNREGKQTGMMSMAMPFAVAEGVSMIDMTPGDKVEFTFEVHWDQNPPVRITSIRALPADTELELSGM